MSTGIAQQIVLPSRSKEKPFPDDFRLEEVAMPTIPPGDVLLRTKVFSLEPSKERFSARD